MSEAESSEEPPPIDDDERADVDLDALSDEIEGVDDDPDDDAEETAETPTETPDADDVAGMVDGRTSVGDVYCGGLGVFASVLVTRYDDEANRSALSDEYESLAREMYLDQFLNEWLREKGRPEDLPPGQAVVVGTVMFVAAVVVTNPTVTDGLMEEINA